jgi:formate hydrogenlyase subunit 6/NADH:ubiquinone oxidoreductase subunit I
MKLGTMLGDVTTSLFRRNATRPYPFQKQAAPARLRGALQFINREACTGCGMCAKDCPALALEVIVLDKAAKRFVMAYHEDRCTFCAQCVASCNHDCLVMSSDDWELSGYSREPMAVYYGEAADVEQALAGVSPEGAAAEPAP